jgi:cytochrome c556
VGITKRTTLSLLLVLAASGTASATDDPIETRQQLMLGNAAAAGAGVAMLRGDTPFSPAVANAVFATMNAVAYSYGDYFPEGSGSGETEASPKIWEDMAGFQAALEKFRADATAAVSAKPQTMEAFQPLFAKVAENCNSCHESYRIEK